MKRFAALSVAVLVLLALAGCSLLFRQHDVSEQPLRETLSDIATVDDVTSSVDRMFGVTYWITVTDLVESDIQAIVERAGKVFAGRDVALTINFDDQGLLAVVYPSDFPDEDLSDEIHYWLALSEANGAPLGMTLGHGPYRDIWDPDEIDGSDSDGSDDVDWDALRAVPDGSTAYLTWYLDDFVAVETMPTPEVVALRDRLAAIPLGDEEKLVVDYFAPGYVEVRFQSPDAGLADPTTAASWAGVLEAVSQLAALDLPQSNFVACNEGCKRGASLYLGECSEVDDEDEPGWASPELVAALKRSGIEFPRGVESGYCNDAAM
jgi:hypothetical protein